jgi:hypothetical protein
MRRPGNRRPCAVASAARVWLLKTAQVNKIDSGYGRSWTSQRCAHSVSAEDDEAAMMTLWARRHRG